MLEVHPGEAGGLLPGGNTAPVAALFPTGRISLKREGGVADTFPEVAFCNVPSLAVFLISGTNKIQRLEKKKSVCGGVESEQERSPRSLCSRGVHLDVWLSACLRDATQSLLEIHPT